MPPPNDPFEPKHYEQSQFFDVKFIDLHSHLRGTIDKDTLLGLARKNNVHLPTETIKKAYNNNWDNFEEFLNIYDSCGEVVRKPEDLYLLARKYLVRSAEEGTLYVEFMLSPDHSIENGISYHEQISAISEAAAEAKKSHGIEAGLIITCVRHRGPDQAIELAELVTRHPDPLVVGFGLTGNELRFKAKDFQTAFMIAGEAGLGLTAHAGEWGDAESVIRSVDSLNLTRIGHGISVASNKHVMEELAERKVGFEVCLSSNLALGRCKGLEEHPLRELAEAGCLVSLATDDAAFFSTSPENEYKLAKDKLGFSDSRLRQITSDAIEMAFCSDEIKDGLREKLRSLPLVSKTPPPPSPSRSPRQR